MRIKIDRAFKKKGYTISRVFIDGERYGDGTNWCNALEDTDRALHANMSLSEIQSIKIPGETAIPRGVYEVSVTYSPKFRKYMPILLDVPGYSCVRIHSGNTDRDTEGCILLGVNDAVGRVSDSRYWYGRVFALIQYARQRGERVWIEIG